MEDFRERTLVPRTNNSPAIADWPAEERPREKLLLKGPEALTNAELLAIFLGWVSKAKALLTLLRNFYYATVHFEDSTLLQSRNCKL